MKYFLNVTIALTRVGLMTALRSPSFLIFSIIFPVFFIIILHWIEQPDSNKILMGIPLTSHQQNEYIGLLSSTENITLIKKPISALHEDLINKRIDMIGTFSYSEDKMNIALNYPTYNNAKVAWIKILLQQVQFKKLSVDLLSKVNIQVNPLVIKKKSFIDFFLPGQIGMALISIGVFGTAFTLLMYRKLEIIKKYLTTPVSKFSIIFSESLSLLLFGVISIASIIFIGYFFLGFTLIEGWWSFVKIMFISIFALLIFLGMGTFISSVVKDEKNVAPYANLFTFPQILLCGTFFDMQYLPGWLSYFASFLPLSFVNNMIRNIAFEGKGFLSLSYDLMGLLIWGVIIYFVTAKVFKIK